MGIKDEALKKAISPVFGFLTNLSDENLVRATHLFEAIADGGDKIKVAKLRELIRQKHPSTDLIRRIVKNHDPNCVKKILQNLVIQGVVLNNKEREDEIKKGNAGPFTILISPTMCCNLNCVGCYANRYSQKNDLPMEVLDRILSEAKEMKVGFITILGGEPFVKKEMYDIYKKHNDLYFQVYTNGTLITDEVCEKLKELGNVFPQVSIEGFEEHTDERRGKGTHEKVLKAMELLKKHKIPFGFSVCVTSKNMETVFSDEFIDMMIEKGALLGWYFLYMPVCGSPDMKLMPTPEQRVKMLERGEYIRDNKPLFIIDFWNDAPKVGGCIAGRYYAHINSDGYVEPCIFTHFAQDNVKDKSLQECMDSDYFKALRKKQPYNENLLLPCQWIDNPEVSREMHQRFKLIQTHPGAEDILENPELRNSIDEYSEQVKKVYAQEWEKRKGSVR